MHLDDDDLWRHYRQLAMGKDDSCPTDIRWDHNSGGLYEQHPSFNFLSARVAGGFWSTVFVFDTGKNILDKSESDPITFDICFVIRHDGSS